MSRKLEYEVWRDEIARVSARNQNPTRFNVTAQVFGCGALFFGGLIGLAGRLWGAW